MKGTEHFKRTIEAYLNKRAMTDTLFASNLQKPNKNIDDCITYILNEVKQSGCNGFADDEIYGMAVHYYDEDELNIGNKVQCSVVVNHVVELTEEEKAEARKQAIEDYQRMELAKMRDRAKTKSKKKVEQTVEQVSLFDLFDNETEK